MPAPKQRNSYDEKAAVRAGKSTKEILPNEPNKAVWKDVDARWTLKTGGKIHYRPDGTPLSMIAIQTFGYKSHISIDRRFGFIRGRATITSAADTESCELRHVISKDNTAGDVWTDSAYRSQSNEKWLTKHMLTSRIQR